MEILTESESILSCKVRDITSFAKQHAQSIRNEVIQKNKQIQKTERETKLIKLRQSCILTSQLAATNTTNQKLKGPQLVTELLPEVLLCLNKPYENFRLERNDIQNLRLVSKTWRLAIDKYFVGSCSYTKYGYFHSPLPRILLNDRNVERLLPRFTTTAPLSYSVQSVIVDLDINCPTKYSRRQFINATTILKVIGKNVQDFTWKTDVKHNNDLPSAVKWYQNLTRWLNSMPNVTALELSFKVGSWSKSDYKNFSTKLDELLTINPFPILGKLMILKVAYNVPNILLSSAVQQNPTIQILRGSIEYPVENAHEQVLGCLWYGFSNLQLNNLAELHLKDFDNHIETTRGTELDLKLLKTVNWPLKILTMDFGKSSRYNYDNRNLQYLFSIANNFERTLTNLRISNAGWTPSTDSKALKLKLPQLEDLFLVVELHPKVRYNPVYMDVDFDFMMELPLLKRLGLHLEEYLDTCFIHEYLEEVIQLQGYFDCLYKSQIWTLLPVLQNVDLSTSCQYEKDYDKSYRYNRTGYKSFLLSLMP